MDFLELKSRTKTALSRKISLRKIDDIIFADEPTGTSTSSIVYFSNLEEELLEIIDDVFIDTEYVNLYIANREELWAEEVVRNSITEDLEGLTTEGLGNYIICDF